jgi:hypothetical protein
VDVGNQADAHEGIRSDFFVDRALGCRVAGAQIRGEALEDPPAGFELLLASAADLVDELGEPQRAPKRVVPLE